MEEPFLSLMWLRGMECNAPSGYAEAFYCRKLVCALQEAISTVLQIARVIAICMGRRMLARLLEPKDFGLAGIVTALTGVLNLFRDFELSTATIQHVNAAEEHIATLCWINVLVGVILGLLAVVIAPVVVVFYHEPRLLG